MNGLGIVALLRLRCLPATLAVALFGLMAPYSTASAAPLHLPPPTPEQTELTSTLSSSSTSGPSITVTEGPRVRDTATLTGPNAASAHGRVTYTLYSDSACTQEIGGRGGSGVDFGSINPSQGARLPAGTYYWQASYSGDARDLPSVSACAAETVVPFIPWECSAMAGREHDFGEPDYDRGVFSVSTNLSARHRFAMRWEGTEHVRLLRLQSASCWIKMHGAVFHGTGTAAFDGVRGYLLRFTIVVADDGRMRVSARVLSGKAVLNHEIDAASSQETTVFAGGVPVDLSLLF
jgi:hypothetical protein